MSLALFRALVPEFAAVADATVEVFLAQVALRMDTSIWGNVYAQAWVYLTAHALKMDPTYGGTSSSTSGAVTAQTDGALSRSYGAGPSTLSMEDAYLLRTSYGAQYLALRDSRAYTGPLGIQLGVT